MFIDLATWNVRESLAEPQHMPTTVEQIKQLDADVVVLGDAYSLENDLHGSRLDTLEEAREMLARAGYNHPYEVEYDDEDPWRHDRNIMMLSRWAICFSTPKLGIRNTIEGIVGSGRYTIH